MLNDADGEARDSIFSSLNATASDFVIPAVIDFLEVGPAAQNTSTRQMAYALLRNHRAATRDDGFAQLLRGLHDPDVRGSALIALRLTKEQNQQQLMDVVLQQLQEGDFPEGQWHNVFELLIRAGDRAAPALDALVLAYRDDDLPLHIRSTAARGLVRIGGTEWAIEQFTVDDLSKASAIDARIVLTALAREAADTESTFGLDKETRSLPRRLIATAMQHEDATIRREAATALIVAYGVEDAVVMSDANELMIHPHLSGPFHKMAQSDPDTTLRQIAQTIIEEQFPRMIHLKAKDAPQ